MARPNKIGLDYYNTDTNKYQDIKIKRLKHAFGANGIAVYDYVLCEIYRVKGCFIMWDENTAFDVADYFGMKETLVNEIIIYCGYVGLFDKELLTGGRVLTSLSIQSRFSKICKDANRKDWLIPDEMKLPRLLTKLTEEETKLSDQLSTQRKVKEIETKKKEREIEIPAQDVFLNYAKENISEDEYLMIEGSLKLKYKSWLENDWKTGKDNEIKNWKSTLLNTIPYLQKEKTSAQKEKNYGTTTSKFKSDREARIESTNRMGEIARDVLDKIASQFDNGHNEGSDPIVSGI